VVDSVFIRQLIAPTIIGVFDAERDQPQSLLVDIDMRCDMQLAQQTDDIANALDYSLVRREVLKFCAQSQYQLLETLAHRLADHLQQRFDVDHLSIALTKKPGDMPDCAGVGVVITRGG